MYAISSRVSGVARTSRRNSANPARRRRVIYSEARKKSRNIKTKVNSTTLLLRFWQGSKKRKGWSSHFEPKRSKHQSRSQGEKNSKSSL
jgi:hypothetical protein